MRLSSTAAAAAAVLILSACGDSGTGTKGAGPPARIDVSASPTSTVTVGGSAGSFTVKVSDANGVAVAGASVTFTTTGAVTVSPASATTDAAGTATTTVSVGTVAGAGSVTASVAGVATVARATVTIAAGAATRIALTPKTVRLINVGDTARVTAAAQDQFGNGVAAGALSWASSDATAASVDQTGLVRALKASSTVLVTASSGGRADTSTVTVLGPNATACTALATATTLGVGEIVTFSGAQYGCLAGTASGAEFALVAFNSLATPTNVTVNVTASGVGAPPTSFLGSPDAGFAALRTPSGTRASAPPRLDESFHLRLLAEANREFRGSFGRARMARLSPSRSLTGSGGGSASASAAALGVIPPNAKAGDVFALNLSTNICTNPLMRGVRVEAIGSKSIVLADTLNPSGGFTTADFQRFAARFDTLVYPVDVGAFGAPSDIDANGRVAIIFTRVVNELVDSTSGYFVGGFFNPRDLFPKVGQTPSDNCTGSNEGEMFYMLTPAPDGIKGVKQRVGFVDSITTGILAHEFQHLIGGSRRVWINTQATDFETVWLAEGLSHIAEELLYYRESGKPTRQNLADSTIRRRNGVSDPTYGFWKMDASSNFQRLLGYLRAPGANSPIANNDELPTRGATWSFLRYAADRLGPSDGTIWQRFDDATVTGMQTLQSVFGSDPIPLLRDWTLANYLDDLGVSADARYQHKSWNFRDIYANTFVNITTFPLRITGLTDNALTALATLGGSASYARFTVPAAREGLLTFSSGGGAPNPAMQFVVVRTR